MLHDEDLAQAIIDRVLERGRLLRLDGPSVRTLHVNLDDAMKEDLDQEVDLVRISGKRWSEFPEPTGRVEMVRHYGSDTAVGEILDVCIRALPEHLRCQAEQDHPVA